MMNNFTFSDIYTQYYKSAFLFVKSYVKDDMAAEDIVSESIIQLWQAMKEEKVLSLRPFLVTILKNNALDYLKHLSVRQTGLAVISESIRRDIQYRITTLEACDPKEIFSKEITEIVENTLQTLPEQTRCIFELSRYEQLPVKEIANNLSVSPKTVEYHITKSLKALRTALREYLPLLLLLSKLQFSSHIV